jgi:hydroxypyruvate isomerase
MQRRDFLKSAVAASALTASVASVVKAASSPGGPTGGPFSLKFGPHDGQFKHLAGDNVLDQIRYAHDQGFTAWEDNRAPRRPVAEQKAMGDLLAKLGMTMGVFVSYADFKNPTFTGHRLSRDDRKRDPAAVRELVETAMHEAVEVGKRLGARWTTIVPGAIDMGLLDEYQTHNTVELLKRCADILEPAGLIAVLEPLNRMNHPGCFLQRVGQGFEICKLVGSPSVKILDDLYHQQITEGNLINNMIDAWDEIAYIQVGDVPGRKEPSTGEINFKHIFQWLHDRGYDGVIGMEHGISQGGAEGEKRLIESYREVAPPV